MGERVDLSQSRYEALRAFAAHLMKSERVGHTLGGTALVHEAYIRIAEHERRRDPASPPDEDPMAVAVTVFRHVLVDHARRRAADKRPTARQQMELPADLVARGTTAVVDLVALGEAIDRLAAQDMRHARIVEYRIFGGYSVAEVASRLGVSISTITQQQRRAIAWLRAWMQEGGSND
ncbi:MAG: sigma-70 family RNA polymerase sigma factor [Phycisphaerales bacterium]